MCGSFIYCDLSGEIPASISNLEEINVLRLEVNYFSGFVPERVGKYQIAPNSQSRDMYLLDTVSGETYISKSSKSGWATAI